MKTHRHLSKRWMAYSPSRVSRRRRFSSLPPILSLVRKYFPGFFFAFFLLAPAAEAEEWQEAKGEHFIINFFQDEKFAKDVLFKAEKYYADIASELGYQRYSGFWTWDNRVKIYIYPDKESFLKATGQPAWSSGLANYTDKAIISYAWSQEFTEALLPHEITHLIFRDYVGFKGEIPLWLDEGVAQWMEPRKREIIKEATRQLFENGTPLSLRKMLALDIRRSQDEELAKTYYIEAVSLVGFLITKYGSEDFINFCRQLRDGKSFEESLSFSYPTSIRGIKELEERWHEDIEGK